MSEVGLIWKEDLLCSAIVTNPPHSLLLGVRI